MNDVQTLAAAPAASIRQPILYDGKLGELYAIFVENILLGIVTLGIYRFWGRTRFRRYLWSHTAFQGDRFEYTGTGGELFRGFLIAFVIFMLGVVGLVAVQFALGDSNPLLALATVFAAYAALWFALLAARYTALRYRLTRTRWRAIRCGLSGSAINFALLGVAMVMLNGVTLLLFSPVTTLRLWEYRLNHAFFGTAPVRFAAPARPLYGRFLASWFGKIVLVALGIAALLAAGYLAYTTSQAVQTSVDLLDAGAPFGSVVESLLDEPGLWRELAPAAIALAVAILVLLAANWFLDCFYGALLVRHMARGIQLADLRLEAMLTTGRLYGFAVGNLLLLVLTLGLAYPAVLHRVWRFAGANFAVIGEIEGTAIAQSKQFMPCRGEGFLNVLDPGGV